MKDLRGGNLLNPRDFVSPINPFKIHFPDPSSDYVYHLLSRSDDAGKGMNKRSELFLDIAKEKRRLSELQSFHFRERLDFVCSLSLNALVSLGKKLKLRFL